MDGREKTLEMVREYYGKRLRTSKDLQSSACCPDGGLPAAHKRIIARIDEEVLAKFYGCGSPVPEGIEGCRVLDLGCGAGRDAFLASALVGPAGSVVGIDMTDEQLDVARRHVDSQAREFGYDRPNVEFRRGFIEDLAGAGIEEESVDVAISNCVINLSPDKERAFSQIFRALKPGGELYFSDVFSGRRVPEALRDDPVLYGECLAGAMYTEDFRRLLARLGVADYRTVSSRRIELENEEIKARVGMVDFYSVTVRAFKLASLEDICEDYGQVAVYRGTIPGCPHSFALDDHHTFVTGKPMTVCGNTAAMVGETRFGEHFEVRGDRSVHFGPFDCSSHPQPTAESKPPAACC